MRVLLHMRLFVLISTLNLRILASGLEAFEDISGGFRPDIPSNKPGRDVWRSQMWRVVIIMQLQQLYTYASRCFFAILKFTRTHMLCSHLL
jgi:hypothetical protein